VLCIWQRYSFHLSKLENCQSRMVHPKTKEYDDYRFIIKPFPVLSAAQYLMAVHEGNL
jgi:hypothetical protein